LDCFVLHLEFGDFVLVGFLVLGECIVLGDYVVGQFEHVHVLVVHTLLHVHDELALKTAVVLLGQLLQFGDLCGQVAVLFDLLEAVECLQYGFVHAQLGFVLDAKEGTQVEYALPELAVGVGLALADEFLDKVAEVLVEGVEVEHLVVVFLQVVVLSLEQVLEQLGQPLVLALQRVEVVHQDVELFLETLGLQRVVDQRRRVDGLVFVVFYQVVGEPLEVLVFVLTVDLRL